MEQEDSLPSHFGKSNKVKLNQPVIKLNYAQLQYWDSISPHNKVLIISSLWNLLSGKEHNSIKQE